MKPPTPEQRRIAAERFERARQVITTGNLDYGVQLLLGCCLLDPANLIYRQELRRAQKKKHKDKMRVGPFAFLATLGRRRKMLSARRKGDHLRVLEQGEQLLSKNPWDTRVQLAMGESADALGLDDVAIFILDQARQKNPADVKVNRALARMLEKRGHFAQAIKLWEVIRKAVPADPEAGAKVKDLAASETIARGQYNEAVASEDPIRGVMHQKHQKSAADRAAEVEQRVQEKLTSEPTEPRNYLDAATTLRKAGKVDEAIELLQKGLAATGNDFRLQLELAELGLEPLRKNLAHAESRSKAAPNDEQLGQLRSQLQKEVNARELEIYRMKADRSPNETVHRLEVGIRLFRAGQIDEAITELQVVRKDERLQTKANVYLGHCFKARNNWRLARRNFEEALQKLAPNDEATRKEILFELATGSATDGDLGKAIDLAHELANLDFAYRDINRLMDEWQAKLQKA